MRPSMRKSSKITDILTWDPRLCSWSCGAASVIWSPLSTRPPQPTYKYCHQIKMFSRQTVCWGTWEKSGNIQPDPNIEYVHHVRGHSHHDHGMARTQELFSTEALMILMKDLGWDYHNQDPTVETGCWGAIMRCRHRCWCGEHHSSLLLPVVGTGCGHNDARTLPLPPSAEGGASGSWGLWWW